MTIACNRGWLAARRAAGLHQKEFVMPKKNDPMKDAGDFDKIGPRSVDGVEASDLPGGGRDSVDTDPGKAAARKLPQNTGGTIGGDVGVRGIPDTADAAKKG